MKKLFVVSLALLVAAIKADDLIVGAPVGSPVTMTGSAIRLVPNPKTAAPFLCNSIFIQSQIATSNPVYVLNAAPSITMSLNGVGTTTVAVLGPGTSTQPGQSFSYPSNGMGSTQSGYSDLRYWGLSGTASDTVIAVCSPRQ